MIGAMFVLNATHPSGAMGSFTFENTRHYRAGVHASECSSSLPVKGGEPMYTLLTPHYFDVMSLTKKEIKDGFSYKWSYSYNSTPSLSSALLWGSPTEAPAYPCQDCNSRKVVTITQPDGSQLVKEFGNVYRLNDGRLLKEEIKNASQQVVQSSSIAYANAQSAGGVFYESYGGSLAGIADPETLAVAPEAKRVTARDGTSYSKTVNSYDSFARPLNVTRASPWASRTDVAAYYDDTGKWILGLESSLTNSDTNIVVRRTTYNANAQPVTSEAFGKLKQTLSYNSDGTIAAVKDGKGNTTTLSSWKRGIPQLIQYADSTRQAAAVDDNGWVTSVTDENGFVTAYGYDVQGRLESITYPSDDSTGWNVVRQVFAPMAQAEYGVAAGHWRQVVSAGNARKVTYFDGLWRPLLTREYDAGNEVATQKFQRFSYDHESRVTFASYPGSSDGLTTGTWNNYDTLGRTTSVSQDSELGLLTSTTEYLSGNQTRVTDARGNKTLTGYQVFDQPAYDAPVWIQHPEGAVTEIARDVFGKPTSIRRHDAGNSVSLTRSYVYDGYQQLCKSIEPETGASANGYDAAGNIVWTASGLSLPSTSSCDADAAFGSGRRIDRSYDARNRITALAFPDGNGNQRWSYWPDGLVKQITTTNGGVATYNSYAYNKRRLLIAETQGQADGETWAMGYVYDANGNLAAHRYPSGQTVGYAPNALGQPTQAGSYATGVSYYPNGAIKQFTYGNGIVHTLTQNARQLPDTSQDAYGGTAFLSDGYDYDANGNVAGISDGATGRNQRGNRTMAYDGLDRLTSAVSPMFGTATYDYDVLDNLTHVVAPGRDHYYCYDGYWQLTNVKTGNCSGSTVIGMSYDVQGNLKNKNGQGFVFDYGNRLREATSKETYRYDGYGRRTLATQSAGAIGSMYDQAGVLRYQKNQRQSKATDYVMLGGSLVAEVDWPFGQTAAVKDYVNWTAVGGATRYVVEESVDGVTWTSVYEGADSSWTSLARPPSTYSYRVSACMPDGTCSAAGNIVHVQQPAFNIVPLLYQLLLN